MRKLAVSLTVVAGLTALVGTASPAIAGPDPIVVDAAPDVEDVSIPSRCVGTALTAGVCVSGSAGTSEKTVGDCVYLASSGCQEVYVTVAVPYAHYGCKGWVTLPNGLFYCPGGIYTTW
jgi:hypothetical protein